MNYVKDSELKRACGFMPYQNICYRDVDTNEFVTAQANENGEAMLPGCYCNGRRVKLTVPEFDKVFVCCGGAGQAMDKPVLAEPMEDDEEMLKDALEAILADKTEETVE